MTYEPGWRWSVDVKPIAGTDTCQFHHLGVVLSGRLRGAMADGTELEVGPGDVFEMPPGHDAWVVGDEPWVCVDFAAMRNYGRTAEHRGERILASILFTDIVDSTATAQRLGDGRWLDVVAGHNERIQFVLNRYSGRLVKTTGDGILALFDGAERAVRAAAALHEAVAGLDIQLRAGVHTGEVEMVPGDVRGVAIHAAPGDGSCPTWGDSGLEHNPRSPGRDRARFRRPGQPRFQRSPGKARGLCVETRRCPQPTKLRRRSGDLGAVQVVRR